MFGDRNNVLIEPPSPAAPVSGLPGGHAPGEGEVHLLDRLSVIYRYRKIVATVVFVVFVAGVVQTMTTTPEYRASASVQVDDERGLPGLQTTAEQIYQESTTVIATQVQALRSKDLIRTVVGPLGLANRPEFNGQGGGPTGVGGAISAVRSRVTGAISRLFGGEPAPATESVEVDPQRSLEDRLVDAYMARLTVSPVEDSRAIRVTFVSTDPVLAAAAANALAQAYIDQNLKRRRGTLDDTVNDLREQVRQGDERIKQAEANLAAYRENNNATALMNPQVIATEVLAAENAWQDGQEKVRLAREAYDGLKSVSYDDQKIDTFPDMYMDAEVVRWKNALLDAQRVMARLTVGPDHPDRLLAQKAVDDARAQLKLSRDMVVERLRTTLVRAESDLTIRERRLGNARNMQSEMGTKGVPYEALQRYRDTERGILTDLQARLGEFQIQANAIRNNVWMLESAIVPPDPFKPDFSRNLLVALFVGFALAGALAFGLDYLDDTIKTPEDITRKLRIPFLGLVPSVRGDKQPVLSGPVPHDFGEAYRALRTSLVFTSGGEATRIITCTSAQPLEGKTTTACNLAMVLAFGGSRVLLIDADMRRPGVHKALKINNTVGLSHLLVGQARVREAIQRTSDPNFCVMTAGRTPPNPSELLSSERMKQLIANLKQGPFDWVVIDTPPVLAVTDAVILTPLVDGVTFVLGAEMTRRRLAERAIQMLMVSRPKVVGAVLNRVNFDRNKYYYSRYYGYQYKSYYGSGSGSTAKA